MDAELTGLAIAFVAIAAAPAIAAVLGRVLSVPVVVIEIVLGVLIGPSVLGWVTPGASLDLLARLGMAMLFFLAGREIDLAAIRGRPLRRATLAWAISLAAGIGIGVLLAPDPLGGAFIGICLTSTALGTIMPVLRDSGLLRSPIGRGILASGTVGQFGPLLGLAIFLSGRHAVLSIVALAVFAALVALARAWVSRPAPPWLRRLVSATMSTSGQFAVRLVLALLAVLVVAGLLLGLDLLLGAFVAGVLARSLLKDLPRAEAASIDDRLLAVGFGFVVPFFFLRTGLTFDLHGLVRDPLALALLPGFVILMLVVRGVPSVLAAEPGASPRQRAVLALFSSTGLAIIVAVTDIAVDTGALSSPTAAALVGAGMVSVLLFPILALAVEGRSSARRRPAPSGPELQ